MDTHETTGQTIARLRRGKGLKQTILAAALGIGQSAYCRRETGATPITPAELAIIAAALQTTVDEILRRAALRPAALRPAGKQLLSSEDVAFIQEAAPVLQRLLQIADKIRLSE